MFVLVLFYGILPAAQILVFFSSYGSSAAAEMANYISSIILVHYLWSNILLMSKLPLLQRHLPHDRRTTAHILSSTVIVLAALYHAIYKIALGYELDPPIWLLMVVLSLTMLFAILWVPLHGFRRLRELLLKNSALSRFSEYDLQKRSHRIFMYILLPFTLLHVLESGIITNVPMISGAGYLLLWFAAAAAYGISGTRLVKHRASIAEVSQFGDVTVMRVQTGLRFAYHAGQYVFLDIRQISAVKGAEHPFSLLSTPTSGSGEELTLAMKDLGDFTSRIKELKAGDQVSVRGPFGSFYPKKDVPLCLIGSGIGIVPLISILCDVVETGMVSEPVQVFFAVMEEKELLIAEKLHSLAAGHTGIELHLLVYQKDKLLYSTEYFADQLILRERQEYYICSSPKVRGIIVESLKELAVPGGRIFFEAFTRG